MYSNNTTIENFQFTKIKHDVNGNPRYVVHFLAFITEADRKCIEGGINYVSDLYERALRKARLIGGKKHHTKGYGGGIVFQSYCLDELVKHIKSVL